MGCLLSYLMQMWTESKRLNAFAGLCEKMSFLFDPVLQKQTHIIILSLYHWEKNTTSSVSTIFKVVKINSTFQENNYWRKWEYIDL